MDQERGLLIDDMLGGIQQRLSLEATVLEQRAAELKTVSKGGEEGRATERASGEGASMACIHD